MRVVTFVFCFFGIAAFGVNTSVAATSLLPAADGDNGKIGNSNSLDTTNSLAVGSSNWVTSYSHSSLVVGYANEIFMPNSVAIGAANGIEAPQSAAFGSGNYILQYDTEDAIFVSGTYNVSLAWSSAGFGTYNVIDYGAESSLTAGSANFNDAARSVMVGTGNSSSYLMKNGVIGGKYNANVSKSAILVLGNGTGSNQPDRKNALVVYEDGDVIITKRQGDISMGIYGN